MSTVVNDANTPNRWFYMSAYATAVKHGYKGTEEEWLQDVYGGAARADAKAEIATEMAETATEKALDSEAYGAGTRDGEPLESDDPAYQNNAQYYSAQASDSATAAEGSAEDSEAYAVGKRDGTDVDSDDPAYHNNSKYYAGVAQDYAEHIGDPVSGIVTSWLEDNIDPESGYALDSSLSSSAAAAPADKVGELKSAIDNLTYLAPIGYAYGNCANFDTTNKTLWFPSGTQIYFTKANGNQDYEQFGSSRTVDLTTPGTSSVKVYFNRTSKLFEVKSAAANNANGNNVLVAVVTFVSNNPPSICINGKYKTDGFLYELSDYRTATQLNNNAILCGITLNYGGYVEYDSANKLLKFPNGVYLFYVDNITNQQKAVFITGGIKTVDFSEATGNTYRVYYDLTEQKYIAIDASITTAINNKVLVAVISFASGNPVSISINCRYKIDGVPYGEDYFAVNDVMNNLAYLAPVAYAYGSSANFDTTNKTLWFPSGTQIYYLKANGYQDYEQLGSSKTVDLTTPGITSVKVYFNRTSKQFEVKAASANNLNGNNVLVASVTFVNNNPPSICINGRYRMDGIPYGETYFADRRDRTEGYKTRQLCHRGYCSMAPSPMPSGYHGTAGTAPENTAPAFKLAKQNGFEWVELDVQFTSDGEAVVCHDDTINRTARNADGTDISEPIYIYNHTFAELNEYDYGIWFGEEYAGLGLPKFKDILILLKNIGLNVLIEMKPTYMTDNQVVVLYGIVKDAGMLDRAEWSCWASQKLGLIRDLDNTATLFYFDSEITQTNIDYCNALKTNYNVVVFGCEKTGITSAGITLLENNFIPLGIYSVESEQEALDSNPYTTLYITNNVDVLKVLYDYYMEN